MELRTSDHFIHVTSPYLAMAFARSWPWIAQLGVESGGRLQRHVEGNLLKPGVGIAAEQDGRTSTRQPATCMVADGGVAYRCPEGIDWQVSFPDQRTCRIRLSRSGGRIRGVFWRIGLAPAVSPPSVWGEPVSEPDFPSGEEDSPLAPTEPTAHFRGPLLIHFPDHGHLRVTTAGRGITVRETLRVDPAMVGLNLGNGNTGYHTGCVAKHHGTVELAFEAGEDNEAIDLELHVPPELQPTIPGVDLSASRWDGLRRHWLSCFALNPATLSLGDNLVLHGIAHLAVHYKSDQSVFTPAFLPGLSVHRFLGRALRLTFRDCVTPEGLVTAAWADPKRRSRITHDFFEGGISSMIALRNHIAATGDWSIAVEQADNLVLAGRFLVGLDGDGDGILEMPFHGKGMTEGRSYRNWWDNFPFGHKDAWVNLLAYRGLGDLAAILARIGRGAEARYLEAWRTRFAAAFDRVFFNPATGVHAGWIDAAGTVHDHMFTCISAMAVNAGLVTGDQARAVLGRLLAKLRAEGYGSWRYGIPGPLLPVTEADGHIWEPMQRWGSYENGGFCGMTAFHFIQALYAADLRDEADAILFSMLNTFEREPTQSGLLPGYMKSLDWRTKEGLPCGYNFLADNYHFLLAGITGHHRCVAPGLPTKGPGGR